MTRREIRNLVRSKIQDLASRRIQNTDLDSWINDAGDDLAYKTKCLRTSTTATTTANAEYTISTDIADDVLAITEVYLYMDGSTWKKLTPTTRTELDVLHDGWMSTDAAVPDEYWYDIQLDLLGLYPKANSDNQGADYLKVYYAQTFTALTADTSTPTLPTTLHFAMVDYVTAVALESMSSGDKSSIVRANNAWQTYYRKITSYLSESKREKEDEDIIMKGYRNV